MTILASFSGRRPSVHVIQVELDDDQFEWLFEHAAKCGHALTASQALRNLIDTCRHIDAARRDMRPKP